MVLYLNGITRKNNIPPLQKVHFYVLPREIVALHADTEVQESLLPLLDRGEKPDTGRIYIGRELFSKKHREEKIGCLCKEFGLYERLTVKEWLTFWRRIYRSPLPAAEAARRVHLEEQMTIRVGNLNFSERKRLQFCLLLFQRPEVIILEEWDQNLDIESKKILLPLLQEIKEEDTAVLMLTANMESALICADSVYQVSEGHIKKIHTETKEKKDNTDNGFSFTKIPARINEKIILFNPPEIDYIESRSGKVILYVNNEEFPCGFTLSELEEKLKSYGFFRCHRSYIVNLQKVRELITWTRNSYSLQLDDRGGKTIPLSKSKMEELKGMLGLK